MSTAKPSLRALLGQIVAASRARSLPKWKSKPIAAPPMPRRPTRMLLDEIVRRGAGERGVEGHDDGAVEPGRRPAGAACRARSRAGTAAPAAGRSGADAAQRSAPPPCGRAPGRARSAAPITARWPRCTPSKLPIATTAPASGPGSMARACAARDVEGLRRHCGHWSERWSRVRQRAHCRQAGASRHTVSARLTNFQINRLFKRALLRSAAFGERPARGDSAMAVDLSMPVLVVDDYNTMVRIIRNLLRQLGFEDVDDANDGTAALAKMRSTQIRTGDLRLEHGADDRLRPAAASARRSRACGNTVHHGDGGIQDRERDRGQEGGRVQLHRQAVQRADAQEQDRGGVRRRRSGRRRACSAHHTQLAASPPSACSPAAANVVCQRARRQAVAAAELLGVDAGDDEQAIDAERARARRSVRTESPIASTRLERDLACRRAARLGERHLVDRPVRLAGVEHLAAHGARRGRRARRRNRPACRRARPRRRDWRRP